MRARDVMSAPVITVTADDSLKKVAQILIEHDIGAVPVVDSEHDLVGIVTESDIVPLELTADPRGQITPSRMSSVPQTVRAVMTTDVVAVPAIADVAWIAELMLKKRVHQIPVVSGEKVVGIVCRSDILRILTRSDEAIQAELQRLLDEEAAIGRYLAHVTGGIATLTGPRDKLSQRTASLLARTVPGVLEVTFN